MINGAALFGTLDSAAATVASAGAELVANVHCDLAAAGGRQLKVDLEALYAYYFRVLQLYDDFDRAIAPALSTDDPYANACLVTSDIAGVAMAVENTTTAASNPTDSMKGACRAVRDALGKHLHDIAATYEAYVRVDGDGATELQAAGSSRAAAVDYGQQPAPSAAQGSFAPTPSGWG